MKATLDDGMGRFSALTNRQQSCCACIHFIPGQSSVGTWDACALTLYCVEQLQSLALAKVQLRLRATMRQKIVEYAAVLLYCDACWRPAADLLTQNSRHEHVLVCAKKPVACCAWLTNTALGETWQCEIPCTFCKFDKVSTWPDVWHDEQVTMSHEFGTYSSTLTFETSIYNYSRAYRCILSVRFLGYSSPKNYRCESRTGPLSCFANISSSFVTGNREQ
jgi:hypothetical protein